MTNKKIDIWIRFVLYLFPIIFSFIYVFMVLKNSNTTITMNSDTINVWYGYIQKQFDFTTANGSIFQSFYNWFTTNITHSTNLPMFSVVIKYIFYLFYVELGIFFKNVMVFIIRVANEMIERGAELGK